MGLRCFKILLAKRYFDAGWAITNQFKYIIILFGLYEGIQSQSIKWTIIIGIAYAIFCYVFGRLWYHFKLIETENEISNLFNPFTRDMRKKLKVKQPLKFPKSI